MAEEFAPTLPSSHSVLIEYPALKAALPGYQISFEPPPEELAPKSTVFPAATLKGALGVVVPIPTFPVFEL